MDVQSLPQSSHFSRTKSNNDEIDLPCVTEMTYGYAACSPRVMWVIRGELGLHLQSSNRVLTPAWTIANKGLSKSTPGYAVCSSKVMRVIREDLGLHLQSSNQVLALSHRGKVTFSVCPWMCRVLTKGHVGCLQGTRPLSSVIKSSWHPVLDHHEKGTSKVYPWLHRVLFQGHVGYPRETQPSSSIIELSTCPVFNHCKKGTFKVNPWLRCMLFKGHAGYLRGTQLSSSIVKSSTHPVSSWKRNYQSLPLDAPRAYQGSCGLSMANSASIFNY